jgi:hypothetical protein
LQHHLETLLEFVLTTKQSDCELVMQLLSLKHQELISKVPLMTRYKASKKMPEQYHTSVIRAARDNKISSHELRPVVIASLFGQPQAIWITSLFNFPPVLLARGLTKQCLIDNVMIS